eukprot:COSAG02_NODE_4311_length_5525_cov_15.117888_4_plen_209_part_00
MIGNYTFDDAVVYCNKNPSCAAFTVNGNNSDVKQGQATPLPTYFKELVARNTDPAWQTYVKANGPATKPTNAATVLRGALVYSLQLAEEFSVVKEWEPFLNKDFDITTTSTWNYALADLDIANPSSTLVRVSHSYLHVTSGVLVGPTEDVLAVCDDTGILMPFATIQKFERAGAPGAIPFNITGYPSVIHALVKVRIILHRFCALVSL